MAERDLVLGQFATGSFYNIQDILASESSAA
jgi:hypothetical protein